MNDPGGESEETGFSDWLNLQEQDAEQFALEADDVETESFGCVQSSDAGRDPGEIDDVDMHFDEPATDTYQTKPVRPRLPFAVRRLKFAKSLPDPDTLDRALLTLEFHTGFLSHVLRFELQCSKFVSHFVGSVLGSSLVATHSLFGSKLAFDSAQLAIERVAMVRVQLCILYLIARADFSSQWFDSNCVFCHRLV